MIRVQLSDAESGSGKFWPSTSAGRFEEEVGFDYSNQMKYDYIYIYILCVFCRCCAAAQPQPKRSSV